jgi:PAS domain S-box-containing protein
VTTSDTKTSLTIAPCTEARGHRWPSKLCFCSVVTCCVVVAYSLDMDVNDSKDLGGRYVLASLILVSSVVAYASKFFRQPANDAGGAQLALALLRNSNTKLRNKLQSTEDAYRRALEEIRELDQLYQLAPVGLSLMERDTRMVRINKRLAEINGRPADEVIGLTLREYLPNLAPLIEAIVEQVFASGKPVLDAEVQGIIPGDSAEFRSWLVSYYPITGPDGAVRYTACVVQEITQLKNIENDQRRQKDLLQSIVDHMPCAVFWKDRQSVCLGANELAARDLGLSSPADMVGKNNFELPLSPLEAESYTQADREVLDSGKAKLNYEEVVTLPDGRRLNVLTSKVPLRSASGEIFGLVAVYLDISYRKQAEQLLEQHARELQDQAELIDLSHDAITVRTTDGKVLFWSKGAEEMYGWSSDEVMGRVSDDFLQTNFLTSRVAIQNAFDRDGRWKGPLLQTCKDGSVIAVASRWTTKENTQGQPPTVLEINTDVTAERDAQQAQLIAKEAAEGANLAKSDFLANMSHEIRTPMTAIMGYADLMLEPDITEADRQESVRVIYRSAAHLLDLINDILDISKIEASKMTVERTATDILQLATDVASLMRPSAVAKGLKLRLTFGDPVARVIQSDPVRAKQVLVNMLGNAIKFTERGEVSLRVSSVVSRQNVTVMFEVTDSGIGMSTEEVRRVFQPFVQADSSTTRRFGGTGLGLSISKRLAELLGGDLTVSSHPRKGSKFCFTIDGGPHEGAEFVSGYTESVLPVTHVLARRQTLRGRILLAEDGPDNQRLISNHLRKAGAEVVIAENGRAAVDLACAEEFDLILMDMQMPVLDGYAATAELRRSGFQRPIIALTAHAMATDREKCIAAGCTDYLAKPIDRVFLLTVLASYLDNCAFASEERPLLSASEQAVGSTAILKSAYASDPEMKGIIKEFVATLPGRMAKIDFLRRERDMTELRRVLHQLKGAGGGYGFDALSRAATVAESALDGGASLETIEEHLNSLHALVASIEGYEKEHEAIHG